MPWLTNAQKQGTALGVLIVAVTLGIVISQLLSLYAISRATRNTATVQELCVSTNAFRAKQTNLWLFVVSLSGSPVGETPAEKTQRLHNTRVFKVYLHRIYAPMDCTKFTGR